MTSPGVQQRLVKMAKLCQTIGDTVQIHAIRVIQEQSMEDGVHGQSGGFAVGAVAQAARRGRGCVTTQPQPEGEGPVLVLTASSKVVTLRHAQVQVVRRQLERNVCFLSSIKESSMMGVPR